MDIEPLTGARKSGFPLKKARWLLLAWITIAMLVRFTNLAGKPPWTDEFATLVFSLGNSYDSVPLNQVMAGSALLQPLQPNGAASLGEVTSLVVAQDNHPPVYFALTHLWLKWFPQQPYVSVWAARALAAGFGVLSVPGMYGLARLGFASELTAQLAAALMAVSPFGVYLAQEARHYTLGVLLAIASLACLLVAGESLWRGKPLPWRFVALWIGVNCLGLAVHYFFCLTLAAEAIALLGLSWWAASRRGELGAEC
ncbi:MAG: hypothetical protein HC890_09105 [Chloroflexaceae bacterium]|nr:hypothetical protein [Chloroflexaceae bacterium]